MHVVYQPNGQCHAQFWSRCCQRVGTTVSQPGTAQPSTAQHRTAWRSTACQGWRINLGCACCWSTACQVQRSTPMQSGGWYSGLLLQKNRSASPGSALACCAALHISDMTVVAAAAAAVVRAAANDCLVACPPKTLLHRSFTRSPSVSAVCRSLGFKRPLPVQSMYIFKQPNIGGEVVSAAAGAC